MKPPIDTLIETVTALPNDVIGFALVVELPHPDGLLRYYLANVDSNFLATAGGELILYALKLQQEPSDAPPPTSH